MGPSHSFSARGGRDGCGCCLPGSLIALGLVLLFGWLGMRSCERTVASLPRSLITTEVVQTVVAQLGALEVAPRFVVATREITAEVSRESITTFGAGWLPELLTVRVGRTVTHIRAPGNRVQYIVDLRSITPGSIEVTAEGRELVVRVASPTIDPQMVDIQSNPAKFEVLVDKDWLHHAFSAQSEVDAAKAAIREAVIVAGSHPAALLEARTDAAPVLEAVIRGMIPPEVGVTQVRVEFQSGSGDEGK